LAEADRPPALMFLGTGSDVGKSLIVAGLCRFFADRGLKVRPFKPQNMSNNAAVTGDGGEIGRAQALQARAARVPLSVHMNPVLLKPQTDVGAQVVVQGRVEGNANARAYHDLKPKLLPRVLESFAIVGKDADLILVEGAGSPAEVNLRQGDIANLGFALAAQVPAVLVADIDRGGVIASLVGSYAVLDEAERNAVAGFIVNKFRGDKSLFDGGVTEIEGRTGWQSFGVVPYFESARALPKEDALALDNRSRENKSEATIRIAVPRLGRIANFDDLDPLSQEPDVEVIIVEPGRAMPGDAQVILIPGSKATLADLADLRKNGWDIDIQAHHRRGGLVVGLCGGYQMLGSRVDDPNGIEGPAAGAPGLGLLDVETVIGGDKRLETVTATVVESGNSIRGYEMHMGTTQGPDRERPWFKFADGRSDGARSVDGRVLGGYIHGVFSDDGFRSAFLAQLREGRVAETAYEATIEAALDGLASHLETHLDFDALIAAAR